MDTTRAYLPRLQPGEGGRNVVTPQVLQAIAALKAALESVPTWDGGADVDGLNTHPLQAMYTHCRSELDAYFVGRIREGDRNGEFAAFQQECAERRKGERRTK